MPGSAPPFPGACRRYAPVARGVASSEGRTFGTHFVGVSTHPGTTALYRVMISCTHFGVLPALPMQRHPLAPLAPLALSPPSRRRQSGRSAASAPRCKHRTPHPTRGADDQRRAFSLPREGLQPCVAPYFADLRVGDMRGPPQCAPMMPPRRRWQAVITLHNIDTQHDTAPLRMRQPRTTSGVRFGWDTTALPRMSPTPRSAKYGVTHSCNPSRGSELPRLYRRCSVRRAAA